MNAQAIPESQKLQTPLQDEIFDVVIVGAGPAGMSAALCAARAHLNILLIERALPGGQAATSYKIYNYLGFPSGILSTDLAARMEQHLLEYSIHQTRELVEEVVNIREPIKQIKTNFGNVYKTRCIIIASGLEPKPLRAAFEQKFIGRGISYYAQGDMESYRDQDVVVIGGGNCACYAAEYLAQVVNKVTIVHQHDYLRAVDSLKTKIEKMPNIDIMWNSSVEDVFGIDHVAKVKVVNRVTGQYIWLDSRAIFIYTGRIPPAEHLHPDIQTDEAGFIVTDEYMRTNLPGVYAAGDIRVKQIRQIATAVSDGMVAAINVGRDIQKRL